MKTKKQIIEKIIKLKDRVKQLENIGDRNEIDKIEVSIKTLQWVITQDSDGGKND